MLGKTLANLCEKEGVDIRLNTNVTKEYIAKIDPEVLIITSGSRPIVPNISGMEKGNVVIVNELHNNNDKIKDNIVVLGGGLAGCEAAVHFARQGKNVNIVEMRDELAIDANIRHRPLLLQEIEKCNIKVYLNHKGISVEENGLYCETANNEKVLVENDTLVVAIGQISNSEIITELYDCAPTVKMIGDCLKVSNITSAIYQGHHAGLDA